VVLLVLLQPHDFCQVFPRDNLPRKHFKSTARNRHFRHFLLVLVDHTLQEKFLLARELFFAGMRRLWLAAKEVLFAVQIVLQLDFSRCVLSGDMGHVQIEIFVAQLRLLFMQDSIGVW